MILYCTLSSAINCVASIALALAVFLRRPRTEAGVMFAWFAGSVALWSMAYLLWQLEQEPESALFFSRLLTVAAIVVPVAYYHCVLVLLDRRKGASLFVGYFGLVLFGGLSFTDWLVAAVVAKPPFAFWPVPGWLYPLYLVFFASYVIASLHMLMQDTQAAEGLRKNQLRLVTLGTAIGFLGGSTNFFMWYDIGIPPVGNGLVAVYVVAVGFAIIKFRLMEVNLLAVRLAAYAALVGLLSLIVPSLVALMTALPISDGRDMSLAPVFFASIITTAGLFATLPFLRRALDAFLERRVFGARTSNRDLIRRLVAKINSASDESEMMRGVVVALSNELSVHEVAVYTRTEFESDFVRRAIANHPHAGTPVLFPDYSPLVQMLKQTERSIVLDEVVHTLTGVGRDYYLVLRRKQRLELVVPIIGDTFTYGFITFGVRADAAFYNDVDLSLLEAIGLQIGLSLRARQLERRASQTEKLISLGTLAAGLAHELRDPLVSIQTFSALLKEHGPDLEFQQEFSAVVQRDVNRIASIVENVAAFAESNKVQMTSVNLGEVLTAAVEIVRPESQRHEVTILLPANEGWFVEANYSQLLQVFLNLIQNSVQAMEGRADSRLSISYDLRDDAQQPLICVTVTDNGPGIEPAMVPHIFEPFTTTKSTGKRLGKHGMGLGLAIVKRIIQHHHGEINVTSVLGQGTTFRVFLPPATLTHA